MRELPEFRPQHQAHRQQAIQQFLEWHRQPIVQRFPKDPSVILARELLASYEELPYQMSRLRNSLGLFQSVAEAELLAVHVSF
jgi:hypothetical protein